MAQSGNSRKVYVKASASGTESWLTGEQGNNFNLNANLIDVSDKSSGWQQFIAGVKGATSEVTLFADDSDTTQTACLDALMDGDSVWVRIGGAPSTGGSGDGWEFEAKVGSLSDTAENGGVWSRTLTLTATGEVTHS